MPSSGSECGSQNKQGWQLSGRTSNLSLVLWYPDEAPGCLQARFHIAVFNHGLHDSSVTSLPIWTLTAEISNWHKHAKPYKLSRSFLVMCAGQI